MSDDVTNFLRSVEQLKDRRDEGDEARSREQEKVLQERKKERQARREGKHKPFLSFRSLGAYTRLCLISRAAPQVKTITISATYPDNSTSLSTGR